MSQQQVTLGLVDWIDADGAREPGQLYRERLDLLAEAETQGFDIYHLAEHHGTPLGLAPSPNVFLAGAHPPVRAGLRAAPI
jgi:alkanesulfonate monooxygenase SsuD/methylene tetrahydromethanopterin reductase-like flavin-dependent oxidoreductase (luciferase family)